MTRLGRERERYDDDDFYNAELFLYSVVHLVVIVSSIALIKTA